MQKAQEISNAAVAKIKHGQIFQGYKLLKEAHKLDPGNTDIRTNLLLVIEKITLIFFNKANYHKACYYTRKAIKLQNSARFYANLGHFMFMLGNKHGAIKSLEKAIEIDSDYANSYLNLGNVYFSIGGFNQAALLYQKAIELDPANGSLLSPLYDAKAHMCDWRGLKRLSRLLDRKEGHESPFHNLIRVANEEVNFKVASAWSSQYESPRLSTPKHTNKKINVGYLSDGFRDFPTGHNLIGVLENHDRSKYNIYCYSWGKNDKSKVRDRFMRANKFIDINNLDDEEAARKIAGNQIDILVDLKGFTLNNRFGILSYKPSPVQISYLGFPGTTGAKFIDYFIADTTVLPESSQKYYSEKILYLPSCYRPVDTDYPKIKINKSTLREKYNLPKDARIFASFNQSYKITSEMFKVWLKILDHSPNNYLWQLESNNFFHKNLAKLTNKIILAKDVAHEEHLERIKAADLALDTYPVNGHTTTVEALISGVPVVTLKGKHFASRVSESVLKVFRLFSGRKSGRIQKHSN